MRNYFQNYFSRIANNTDGLLVEFIGESNHRVRVVCRSPEFVANVNDGICYHISSIDSCRFLIF